MNDETRLVVGCMSGTSMDGIDAALVEIRGRGLEMSAKFVRGASGALGAGADVLRRLAHGEACTAREISQAARDLSLAHVAVIREVAGAAIAQREGIEGVGTGGTPVPRDRVGDGVVSFVCVHGQTVFHAPPLSWQVMNAAVIAQMVGVPVVHDLRAMDLAAGGQGAPITPIADRVLFRSRAGEVTCVVNLGGFANATIWREGDAIEHLRGFDICACNQILDALARERLGSPFDRDGEQASLGRIDAGVRARLHTTLTRQWREGRSLGTGDEAKDLVVRASAHLTPEDACATAADVIGEVIATAIDDAARRSDGPRRVLLAGGGARHGALRDAIAMYACVRDTRTTVATTGDRGVPIELREAVCFAVLGALCQDGVAITLPAVTRGQPGVISGSWTGVSKGTLERRGHTG